MITKIFISFLIVLGTFSTTVSKKAYHKEFYPSGILKTEGWVSNGEKNDYWKNYHSNGKLESQGHYINGNRENYWYFYTKKNVRLREGSYVHGEKINWWLFYDTNGNINHKCQLKNNIKDGYCLKYKNKKLTSAVKYKKGVRIKEWTTFATFKKENKLSDLQ